MPETYWDQRIETLPASDLARLQRHRLNWQLRRCWDGSPFYRERLEAASLATETFADADILTRLPVLTMSDLLAEHAAYPPFGRLTVAPEAWWIETDDEAEGPRRVWTDGDVAHRADLAARARCAAANYPRSTFGVPGIAPTLAYECAERNGLHWVEDHFLIEAHDSDTGKPVPDGALGELALTDLTREGSPLIRIMLGYVATLDRRPCACGRTSARSPEVRPLA